MATYFNAQTGQTWDSETGEITDGKPRAGSGAEAFALGAKRTVGRLKGGVQDVYSFATQQFSPEGQQRRGEIRDEQAAQETEFARQTSGEKLPAFAGQMAPYLLTGGKGATGRALSGAMSGLLTYNEDPSTRALQGAAGLIGGALGSKMALPKMGGRLAQRADELGFKRTPGQIFNAPGLQKMESSIEAFPPTSGAVTGRKMANQKILNQIAAKSIGEEGTAVTPEMLDQGAQRIGDVFDDVAVNVKNISLGDDFIDKLAKVEEQAQGTWIKSDPIKKVIDNALDEAVNGTITGKRYLQLSSMLGKKIRAMEKSQAVDPEDAFMLKGIKNALDDQFESAVSGADLERLKEARLQWNNLMTLETGATTKEAGNVSGPLLSGVLRRKDKIGYRRGRNKSDLYDAARIAGTNRDIVGDSGTATRSFMQWMLGGDPTTIGFKAAAGIAANPLARAYMNSPGLLNSALKQLPTAAAVPGTGLLRE